MHSLVHSFMRLWDKAPTNYGDDVPPFENASDDSNDNLAAISGIGVVIQDRLMTSGIRSYADLIEASPNQLEAILGRLASQNKIEAWKAEARDLSNAALSHTH